MAFRAFYALPTDTFVSSTGQHTNAIYGFTTMLVRLLEKERPSHVAVAFDLSRHSFRTEIYPEYKGTRDATPEEFKGQVELIEQVLDAMGIRHLTKEDHEADDILATLARMGAEAGKRVLVASGDRDSFQLVNDRVTVLYPGQGPGDLREMTPEAIEAKYGVPPQRYPELAALVGETSDNLPGVPGVGPKTAAQWITKFDGLDNLLSRADEVGGKRGEALREHIDDVRRNRRLNRLLDDLDLGITLDDVRMGGVDAARIEDLFDTLEFGGLRHKVIALGGGADTTVPAEEVSGETSLRERSLSRITPDTDIAEWWAQRQDDLLGLLVEPERHGLGIEARRLALVEGDRVLVTDLEDLDADQVRDLEAVLDRARLVTHDAKTAHHALRGSGLALPRPVFDVELGAYLLRPEQRYYDLPSLAKRLLEVDLEETTSSDALFEIDEVPSASGSQPTPAQGRLARNAGIVMDLHDLLGTRLESEGAALVLMNDMELPLQATLLRMEEVGIAVDEDHLASLSDELGHDVDRAERAALDSIGEEINLSSPKQIQYVLFDKLGLPKTKKTKRGWTTNAEALQTLWERTGNPFLEQLLIHRDRIKLKQMVDSLRGAVHGDGRIHTTFSQVATATGRLASSDPNLQNIPTRTEDGRRIRRAFVAGEGFESLMSADYSQIEMRIMAHLSEDAGLIDAFNSGEDLHRTMASMVFGVPVDEVTPDQRSRIKATSYGLAYGLSAYGLSAQLRIPVGEASELRDRYFERFSGVKAYLDSVVARARREGYTETMFGRRRHLPELRSSNRQQREMAERAALNAPIQGSAADIVKIAMLGVERALVEAGLRSRMLVQIHDELLLEIFPGEREAVEALVVERMGAAARMSVPLDVAVGVGRSWLEAAH